MSGLNGHHPDINYAGQWAQYHGSNDNLHHGNRWYDGPTPPNSDMEEQHTYQMTPNTGRPTLENIQQIHFPPGPSRGEYDIPPLAAPAPGIPVRDRPPVVPDPPDVSSSGVPGSAPPRIQATGHMKRLANSFYNDPNAKVDALCMELKPSIGKLRVQITLDIDVGVDAN